MEVPSGPSRTTDYGLRVTPHASRSDLALNVVDFVRLLERNEFLVCPPDAHDVLRALTRVDIGDRQEFYLALRAILLRDPQRQPLFDELFDRFWGPSQPQLPDSQSQGSTLPASTVTRQPPALLGGMTYSPLEVLYQKDFADFQTEELGAVARACVAIAKQVATRKSRRVKVAPKGSRVDPRRTIRRNLKYGGTVLELARVDHKIRKPRIVLLCDVSRSMEQYSVFLLQFIHSMQNLMGGVESFVFSTSLHRVSHYFKHADIMRAVEEISQEVPDWSGGTRIGESLKTFNEDYARRMVDRRTVVVVLSDGLDTGQTEVLAEQMGDLHARAAHVIWLNPLLGKDSYQPLARGMVAALPHVDVFAAAHNLASLQQLARSLARIRGRRASGSRPLSKVEV